MILEFGSLAHIRISLQGWVWWLPTKDVRKHGFSRTVSGWKRYFFYMIAQDGCAVINLHKKPPKSHTAKPTGELFVVRRISDWSVGISWSSWDWRHFSRGHHSPLCHLFCCGAGRWSFQTHVQGSTCRWVRSLDSLIINAACKSLFCAVIETGRRIL